MIIAIVDADPIVYRAGFAGEKHLKHVIYEDKGVVQQIIFTPTEKETAHAQYLDWEKRLGEECILEVDKIIEPEPLSHVLHTVKTMLRDTQYSIAEHFNCPTKDVHLIVLLSGPGNFRMELATIAPYKGNRKEQHKPHWYQQIRNYLTDEWDAEVIEGREADDECSILQGKYAKQGVTSVVCSIDKDLDMVPGCHYDYVRRAHYFISEDEGQAFFYKQCLSGDSTDNIPGAYKIGAVRAATIVDNYLLDNPGDYAGLWEEIVKTYEATIEKYGDKCPYTDAESAALETARLVWMQQYPGQLWTPPGQPDETFETKEDRYE